MFKWDSLIPGSVQKGYLKIEKVERVPVIHKTEELACVIVQSDYQQYHVAPH